MIIITVELLSHLICYLLSILLRFFCQTLRTGIRPQLTCLSRIYSRFRHGKQLQTRRKNWKFSYAERGVIIRAE